jgi:hypothetical protein
MATATWIKVNPRVESFSEPDHGPSRAGFADREDVGSGEWQGPAEARAEEARRERGLPGGEQGRIDVVGSSGIYLGSGPYPEEEVPVRAPGEFVHGQ